MKLLWRLCSTFVLSPIVFCLCHKCLLTSPDIEGPYYHAGAPLTNTTVCDAKNKNNRLIVHGRVTDSTCKTGVQALLDVWQANENALYSDGISSFECRGKIITDVQGHYRFSTVWPAHYEDGPYGFRPSHIHFKISPLRIRNFDTLTTQMYFKNDTYLGPKDPCYPYCHSNEPSLQTRPKLGDDGKAYHVMFNIVLNLSNATTMDDIVDENDEKTPYY